MVEWRRWSYEGVEGGQDGVDVRRKSGGGLTGMQDMRGVSVYQRQTRGLVCGVIRVCYKEGRETRICSMTASCTFWKARKQGKDVDMELVLRIVRRN